MPTNQHTIKTWSLTNRKGQVNGLHIAERAYKSTADLQPIFSRCHVFGNGEPLKKHLQGEAESLVMYLSCVWTMCLDLFVAYMSNFVKAQ